MEHALILLLLLGLVAQVNGEEGCVIDTATGQTVEESRLENFVQRWSTTAAWGTAKRMIIRMMKRPNSLLSKMMGSATADPTTWDDSQNFDLTTPPSERTPMWMLRFMQTTFGTTRTVYAYLWNYGYIAKVLELSQSGADAFNGNIPPCALTNAIREFQLFNNIEPADGQLSKETIKKMAEARCGNLDVKCTTPQCLTEDRYSSSKDLRRKRYAVRRKKWKGSGSGSYNIAYYYENDYDFNEAGKENHDHTMTMDVVKREIEKGLSEWTNYAGLNFIEVSDKNKAHVTIRFGSDAHGEKKASRWFDGSYGVLAHMYYPRKGEMHFDQSENWSASTERGGKINMHFVAAHEMGHGLGIEHSNSPSALMVPYYLGWREQMMRDDDVKAVRHLYGIGSGSVHPLEGEAYVAPEGLGTGIDEGLASVIRTEGKGAGNLEEGEGDGEEQDVKTYKDKCAQGDSVSFQETKDLGHCINGFEAGFTDPDEDHIYLFYNSHNYLRLYASSTRMPVVDQSAGKFSELFIRDAFPGLEGPYDAAVTDNDKRISYLFVDGTVTTWDWATDQVGDLNRTPIDETDFSGLPEYVDAVAKFQEHFLFFAGDEYFIYTADEGVSGPFPADLDGETIASAFHSFYNGYIFTTIDSFNENSIYNLIKAKKLTRGVSSAEQFQESVLSSYSNVEMDFDPMFGWPCGLGFCGMPDPF